MSEDRNSESQSENGSNERSETSMREGVTREAFSMMVHDHQNQYISLADRKASILLSAQLAFLALSANLFNNVWSDAGNLFKVLAIVTGVLASASALFSAKAIYPNTPETPQGLVLWKSIEQKGKDDYKKQILDKSEEDLLTELIDENYQLAVVSCGKYDDVRWALRLTGASIVAVSLTAGVLFM